MADFQPARLAAGRNRTTAAAKVPALLTYKTPDGRRSPRRSVAKKAAAHPRWPKPALTASRRLLRRSFRRRRQDLRVLGFSNLTKGRNAMLSRRIASVAVYAVTAFATLAGCGNPHHRQEVGPAPRPQPRPCRPTGRSSSPPTVPSPCRLSPPTPRLPAEAPAALLRSPQAAFTRRSSRP